MPDPAPDDLGAWFIETLRPPTDYPVEQILFACSIARAIDRGKFVLAEMPWRA
jgi:hypothetical protein